MPAHKKRKILIVDDDPQILNLLLEALHKDGHITQGVSCGEMALATMKQWQPDLVLMDQDMPGLSGLETLKKLRSLENYTSVIFVSAHATPQIIIQSLEAGADDYVSKPFNFAELRTRVKVRLRINDLQEELKQANEQLKEMVDRDYLTGLYNMRSMYERIDHELARAKRFKRQVAAIMMDMDFFKTVNDTNNHLFGSFVLTEVGKILQKNLREIDFAARYGGDEFLVILTETNEEGTKLVTERLRKAIESREFKNEAHKTRLTASIGYAIFDPEEDLSAQDLVKRADRALYTSKNLGRNQVNPWKA